MGERKNWTREETILAFDLYCRTAFGKIDGRNKNIIELANLLGRTPDAVALKMHNLAHYDPELRARNITAMSHGSRLDPIVFDEFYQNIGLLSETARTIRISLGQQVDIPKEIIADIEMFPEGAEKERQQKTRVGQYWFRTAILTAYNNHCCITGLNEKQLLRASHIKPWAVSDAKTEKTNPCNGLCLNSLHDEAFDRGLITVDKNAYSIIISRRLQDAEMDVETRAWFMSYGGRQIILPDKFRPAKEFLEYHNDVVFQT